MITIFTVVMYQYLKAVVTVRLTVKQNVLNPEEGLFWVCGSFTDG